MFLEAGRCASILLQRAREYCGYSPSEQEEQRCSRGVHGRAFALCGLGGQPALLCDVLSFRPVRCWGCVDKIRSKSVWEKTTRNAAEALERGILFLFLYSCHMRIRIVSSCLCEYWSCSFIYLLSFMVPSSLQQTLRFGLSDISVAFLLGSPPRRPRRQSVTARRTHPFFFLFLTVGCVCG